MNPSLSPIEFYNPIVPEYQQNINRIPKRIRYREIVDGQRPFIVDYSNAQHNHRDAAGGGRLSPLATLNKYCFRVHKSADQAITNNTLTTVTYDTEDFDPNGNFATNSYIAPVAGYYQFNANMQTNNTAGFIQGGALGFTVNGSTYPTQISEYDNGVSYDFKGWSISDCILLAAGDSVTVQIILYISGATNLLGSTVNNFSGFLVSPSA